MSFIMLSRTHLNLLAKMRLNQLQYFQQQLKHSLETAPVGKVKIVKCRTSMCYYFRKTSSDPTGEYIRKKDVPKYARYLQKHYNEKALKMVDREIKGLRRFLDNTGDLEERITNLYGDYPENVRAFIHPIDKANAIYLSDWEKTPYTQMARNPERHIHRTERGEWVRSKSEMNIANALYHAGIPYRYEAQLSFGEKEEDVYPDFTIYDTKHMRVVYLEHLGLMDDMTYARGAVKKIKKYMRHGIFLGDRLIISGESSVSPLTTDDIEMIINHYFK